MSSSAEGVTATGLSEGRIMVLSILVATAAWFGQGGQLLGLSTPWRQYIHVSRSSIVVLVVAVVIALVRASPTLVMTTITVLSAVLGIRSAQEYQPMLASSYVGIVHLVTDPEPSVNGWWAEARLQTGERVVLSGSGFAADALGSSEAGKALWLTGKVRPIEDGAWVRSRHLVGRVTISEVRHESGAPWFYGPSNGLRALVRRSAAFLGESQQELYLGLVIGDDRFQPASQRAQFRAAGLSHLLAVSGQNVAFVLAVAGPFTRRLGLAGRVTAICVILMVFALATRMEPSVLRATAVAGIATVSVALGRRSTGLRTLGLATIGLVLVDPLLVNSVGFGLSVSASVGILALGPSIRARLRGPAPLVDGAAITLAAQLGVAPLLVGIFGPISLVSVPANLLVGWAAGLTMTWGLTIGLLVGILADVVPKTAAQGIQMPAHGLTWWIDAIAVWASRAPVPRVGGPGLAVLGALGVAIWRFRESLASASRASLIGVVLGLWWLVALSVPSPPRATTKLDGGGTWFIAEGGPTILVVDQRSDHRLLDSLVNNRITTIDIVILRSGGRSVGPLVENLRRVAGLGMVFAPTGHRVVGATRLVSDIEVMLDDGSRLIIATGENRLDIEVLGRHGSG